MIVTECDTFNYNPLPMGVCALVDTFQTKLYELISDIKGVNIYI